MNERVRFAVICGAVALCVSLFAWFFFADGSPQSEEVEAAARVADSPPVDEIPTAAMTAPDTQPRGATAKTRTRPSIQVMPRGNGLITGWVEYADGRPGGGLTVEFELDGFTGRNVMAANRPMVTTQSDDSGHFVRGGLANGRYALRVSDGVLTGTGEVWIRDGARADETLVLRECGDISGRVVDSTGAAVANARVAPAPVGEGFTGWTRLLDVLTVSTDDEGQFVLSGVPVAPVRVIASAPDSRSAISDAVTPSVTGMELVLDDGTQLAGATLDAVTKEVVGGVTLLAWPRDVLGPPATTTSNASGLFVFSNVRPTSYSITLEDSAYVLAEPAEDILLEPGGKTDITVLVSAGGRIAGRVVIPAKSEGAPGMRVLANRFRAPQGGERYFTSTEPSDADGAFTIQALPPGHYGIQIDSGGKLFQGRSMEVWLQAGQTVDDLELPLIEGVPVRGRVVDDAEEPVGEALVSLENEANGRARTRCDLEGQFEFTGIAPFEQAVLQAEFGARKSATYTIDMPGAGENVLRLAQAGTGVLEGHIVDLDGNPVKGYVNARSDSADSVRNLSANSDDDGHFAMRRISAGTYTLNAGSFDGPGSGQSDEPVVLAEGQHIDSITLVINAHTKGDLDVNGIVVDEAGSPVERAQVFVAGRGGTYIFTDASGHFSYADLPMEEVRLSAHHPTTGSGDAVASASNPVVRIVLAPADASKVGPIHGQVVDGATGRPISRFRVDTYDSTNHWKNTDWFRNHMIEFADPDGRFELAQSSEAGRSNTLYAWAEGYAVGSILGPFNPETGYTIALEPGRTVSGRVVDQNHNPVSGAYVYAGPIPDQNYRTYAVMALSDPEGRFTLTDLAVTTTQVSASYPRYSNALVDVPAGDNDVSDLILQLFSGTSLEIHVALNKDWDASGILGGASSGGENSFVSSWRADASGVVRIDGVMPGMRHVSVSANPKPPIRGGWNFSAEVEVAEGRTTRLDFTLPPCSASLEGIALSDGEPVPGVTVNLSYYETEAGTGGLSVLTDGAGRYRFGAIPEGTARFFVHGPDPNPQQPAYRRPKPVDVQLPGGHVTQMDVELTPKTDEQNAQQTNPHY